MSVTIKDVAQRSGISIATVSKYLNGVPVRKKTADKVSQAIRELAYCPNPMARGLRSARTMTFGILVDNITNIFYASIISQLTVLMRQCGYSCLVYQEDSADPATVSMSLDFLASKKVDGLFILTSNIHSSLVEGLNSRFRNIVVIDCFTPGLTADFVFTDNLSAAYHATEQFIIRNHRNIAIITGFSSNFSAHERLNGYLRAIQDHGIPVNENWIFQENYDMDGGYNGFQRLWALPPDQRPTAMLVTSYFMMVGTLIAVNQNGVSIPKDISIICFDNYDINKVFQPALTCVVQPTEAISKQAADFMLERLFSETVIESRIRRLAPQISLGESVQNHPI